MFSYKTINNQHCLKCCICKKTDSFQTMNESLCEECAISISNRPTISVSYDHPLFDDLFPIKEKNFFHSSKTKVKESLADNIIVSCISSIGTDYFFKASSQVVNDYVRQPYL